MVALSLISSIVCLVCWIIVLTKLFPSEGVGWGIFGIICGLYAFIWGWQNANNRDIKNVMIIWSIGIGLGVVLNLGMTSS